MSKLILYLVVASLTVDSYYCFFTEINFELLNQTIDTNNNESTSNDEIENVMPFSSIQMIKVPGTKWCGSGNSADNYNDLGTAVETDMCCRDHDNCPDVIPGGGTKYGLSNDVFYTRLNCACDDKFHDCLKTANTKTAKLVGAIYFDTLQTKCYREDYPVTGCVKKGGLLNSKCLEYSYNTSGEKTYQWFSVPSF